jgi:hypothetical protein
MLIVIDNVLDNAQRESVVMFFTQNLEARVIKWEPSKVDGLENNQSPIASLLTKAANYFNLSSMVGSEYWAHYGTKPNWHVDKDEERMNTTGELSFPICSIVYYGVIENLKGGRFMTETEIIMPKTNRMIVFSSGILHTVEEYSGTRLSVAVNPWSVKPMESK